MTLPPRDCPYCRKLMWVKVTPSHGRPYFLIPDAGGHTYIRRDSLDTGLKVPLWVLFTF